MDVLLKAQDSNIFQYSNALKIDIQLEVFSLQVTENFTLKSNINKNAFGLYLDTLQN